jgi:hypothetical protein
MFSHTDCHVLSMSFFLMFFSIIIVKTIEDFVKQVLVLLCLLKYFILYFLIAFTRSEYIVLLLLIKSEA